MILVMPEFFTAAECSRFLKVAERASWRATLDEFWNERAFHLSQFPEEELEFARRMLMRKRAVLERVYCGPLYCDTIDLVRWPTQSLQPPHIDGCAGLEYRSHGAVVYLNDDFGGGQLYYPKLDIEIAPRAGTLVVHPGTDLYQHGVRMVYGATRYTVASFWSVSKVIPTPSW
jgi:hypothetical protein